MWSPPSPDDPRGHRIEVIEEPCIEIQVKDKKAIPFFTHDSGAIFIKNGTVVTDDKVMESTDLIVEDGKIVEVGSGLEVPSGAKVIDATDKFIMPGGIDTCTNFKGQNLADDFQSGSRAALSGGTTTVVNLVVPDKDESLLEALASARAEAEENACCDVAFTVAVPRWNEEVKAEMETLVKQEGINAFKVFMAFKGELMLTNEEILEVFDHCKALGAVVHVHAENGTIIAENEKRLRAK